MNFDLIVEPGSGIGPVKLGMTRQEIESLDVELSDDRFRVGFDDEGRCNEIELQVFNNPRPDLLSGHDLNNISIEKTEEIFLSTFGDNATDREDLGIRCLEWEMMVVGCSNSNRISFRGIIRIGIGIIFILKYGYGK